MGCGASKNILPAASQPSAASSTAAAAPPAAKTVDAVQEPVTKPTADEHIVNVNVTITPAPPAPPAPPPPVPRLSQSTLLSEKLPPIGGLSKLHERTASLQEPQDDMPGSPMPLKSSRSLNRSIGVRRRESEADGGTRLRPEEEEAGPDPLREQFEATKDTNPLLVRKPTVKSGLAPRISENNVGSVMRKPSVGFSLQSTANGQEQYDGGLQLQQQDQDQGYRSVRDDYMDLDQQPLATVREGSIVDPPATSRLHQEPSVEAPGGYSQELEVGAGRGGQQQGRHGAAGRSGDDDVFG